jgi:hypothetical protein
VIEEVGVLDGWCEYVSGYLYSSSEVIVSSNQYTPRINVRFYNIIFLSTTV